MEVCLPQNEDNLQERIECMIEEEKYLIEEDRDGFHVDQARKKLWYVELSIMEEIDTICKKHGIQYFLICGASIGAMRHKGFIPWDDDLDIGMLRSDFDKFIEASQKEMSCKYELQYGIVGDIVTALLRIRDGSTTGILSGERFSRGNQGIFVEIYPFDNVPDGMIAKKLQYALSSVYSYVIYDRFFHFNKGGIKKLITILFSKMSNRELWHKWEKLCKKYNHKPTKYVDTIMLTHYAKQGIFYFKRENVADVIKVPFEFTELYIGVGNDECLRLQYGDYMQLPPKEKRGVHHDTAVFYDPYHPYTYWLGKPELENHFRKV